MPLLPASEAWEKPALRGRRRHGNQETGSAFGLPLAAKRFFYAKSMASLCQAHLSGPAEPRKLPPQCRAAVRHFPSSFWMKTQGFDAKAFQVFHISA